MGLASFQGSSRLLHRKKEAEHRQEQPELAPRPNGRGLKSPGSRSLRARRLGHTSCATHTIEPRRCPRPDVQRRRRTLTRRACGRLAGLDGRCWRRPFHGPRPILVSRQAEGNPQSPAQAAQQHQRHGRGSIHSRAVQAAKTRPRPRPLTGDSRAHHRREHGRGPSQGASVGLKPSNASSSAISATIHSLPARCNSTLPAPAAPRSNAVRATSSRRTNRATRPDPAFHRRKGATRMKSTASSTTAKLVAPAQVQVRALTSEVEAQGRNAAPASTSAVAAMLVPLSSASGDQGAASQPRTKHQRLERLARHASAQLVASCDAT